MRAPGVLTCLVSCAPALIGGVGAPGCSSPDAGDLPMPREVWTGSIDAPMSRDEAVFAFADRTTILSGTGDRIVEYDVGPQDLEPSRGTGHQLAFHQNGVPFDRTTVSPWEVGFHRWESGPAAGQVYLYCSLWAPAVRWDFTAPGADRSVRLPFAFLPLATTRRTTGGFPLDWEIQNGGEPVYADGTAGVDVFEADGVAYVVGERRLKDIPRDGFEATCLYSRVMTGPTRAPVDGTAILCPGPYLGGGQWDLRNPYPSEVIAPNISLVEGTRVYRAGGKIYVFYSSGSYLSRDNYGGFVAVCPDLASPCAKVMEGGDVRVLVPGLLPDGYYMVGRPFPVAAGAGLANIVFHARHPVDFGDDILRCAPTRWLGDDFLADFESGRRTCAPGPAGPFCGDGACQDGEICAADCGQCAELVLSVAATQPTYQVGDRLAAVATLQNGSAAPTGYGVGATVNLYRDGARVADLTHGPIYFPAGASSMSLPPAGTDVFAQVAGAYRLELVLAGGACRWTAETTFQVE